MKSLSDQSTLETLPLPLRENLGTLDRRILELADWIERDCREPDVVITYAQALRSSVLREARSRYA